MHTIRDVGAVTRALCAAGPRRSVGVRGPFGTRLAARGGARARTSSIVAGGLGLAPLRPAIYRAFAHRARLRRGLVLLYGARTPADLLFRGELERWRVATASTCDVTVDARQRDWRRRASGSSRQLDPARRLRPRLAVALVCGPELMMRFTARALAERGVPPAASTSRWSAT